MAKRKYIKINKLFGKYDNELDLSSRAIIFIGENGVGKTTIMKILQNLMNFNFAELIKYDFESIDIEVTAKNGKLLKDTIKYEDLLPTDEEISEYIKKSDYFRDDYYQSWDWYRDGISDEDKISSFDDDEMTDEEKIDCWDDNMTEYEFEQGNFVVLTDELLKDLIKRKEIKNIIRKIIKKEEFNDLYYKSYIDELNKYDVESNCYLFEAEFDFNYNSGYIGTYDDLKDTLKNIINLIKEFIDKILDSNKEINFSDKDKIIKMIKLVIDNIDKFIDILDMMKVYSFENSSLTSSLITNKLLEWKISMPNRLYSGLFKQLEENVYKEVIRGIEYGDFENQSKDISELNSINTIKVNSIINHYFYNEDFILDINKKSLKYYMTRKKEYSSMAVEKNTDKSKVEISDKFTKYIRPIILRHSPFDTDYSSYVFQEDHSVQYQDKYIKMFCDFCTNEWHLFEKNINPKMKILQELLDKYMMNKNVEITPMGLIVKSKGDNRDIPLNSLSSGEKNY